MRRVMIFLPPRISPAPAPAPAPAPTPTPPSPTPVPPSPSPLPPTPPFAPPVAFAEKQALEQKPLAFMFYVVEGNEKNPEVVCLESTQDIQYIAGPYQDYDVAKKIQNDLLNTPPTP